jgi:hypothetical protein
MDRRALTRLRLGFRSSSGQAGKNNPQVGDLRYDDAVRRQVAGILRALVFMAGVCSGQNARPITPSRYLEIHLPPEAISEGVFVRYRLSEDELGGWILPQPGVSSYNISTVHDGLPASRIKAIVYVPGCAIQTLDLPVSGSDNQRYSFACHPLSSVWINGALTRTDWLFGREVKLQVKYVARWAQSFLGLADDLLTNIPVGDVTYLSSSGRFRLSVPDFAHDPLAGSPDHAGELQFWARDKTGQDIVAQLSPVGPQVLKTGVGGLKIQSEYPSETVFTPCTAGLPHLHDEFGFGLRPDARDLCDR